MEVDKTATQPDPGVTDGKSARSTAYCPSLTSLHTLPPYPLCAQVRSFFMLCWRQSPVLYDEVGFLRDVHGPLRAKILRHVGSQIRPLLPILQVRAPCDPGNTVDAMPFSVSGPAPCQALP